MAKEDLYTRKTAERLKRARARMFMLRLKAANSPYDLKTIYPQKFSLLTDTVSLLKRNIKRMETDGWVNSRVVYRFPW